MSPQELIIKKRNGGTLDPAEIKAVVAGVTDESWSEGQVAAFAMATFFRGMELAECAAFMQAMANSGTVMDWSEQGLDGPVIDKHSTGGVGDKVSLMLAPMMAACGVFVPMISGRALGHSGGTLDKLDAIPGYVSQPDLDTLRRVVKSTGCAIIGQTSDLAPADRRLYSIRDTSGTVEIREMVVCSILSKKVAEGLDALVLDVKHGSGAFMREYADAKALAEMLVGVAAMANPKLPATACLTDMNQVLGKTAGHTHEVREAVDYLTGAYRDPRLHEVTLELCARSLVLGGLADSIEAAREKSQACLDDGSAAERFAKMVRELHGPSDLLESPDKHLPYAQAEYAVVPPQAGYLAGMDAREIGYAVIALGGGRLKPTDSINHTVGLYDFASIGDAVSAERPICRIHAASKQNAELVAARILASCTISEAQPDVQPVIAEVIKGASE